MYKERHLDDTDVLEAVGVSSENEAKRMKGILGISRRLPKSAPPTGVPEQSKPAQQGEGEGLIQTPERFESGTKHTYRPNGGQEGEVGLSWNQG